MIFKAWGLPVVWIADIGRAQAVTAQATVIHVHVHLGAGMRLPDLGHVLALPPGSVASEDSAGQARERSGDETGIVPE